MSGHTPGPWMIAPNSDSAESFDIVSEYEPQPNGTVRANWIAECDIQEESHPGENLANAHLIAAAPELLRILKVAKMIVGAAAGGTSAHEVRASRSRVYDEIEAAIAKAEGRP